MQLVGGDKFKFFPVTFGSVIIPLGNIKAIRHYSKEDAQPQVEIHTYTENSFYPKISFEQAQQIWEKAFKDCEY